MFKKLDLILDRYNKLNELVADPNVIAVMDEWKKYSKELSDYYKKISGTHIKKHTVSKNGLRETVFENGVKVYVNYTDKTLQTPIGKIAPYEYLITE